MKIDIEGHEYQALLGGSKAVSEGLVENLLLEINPSWLKKRASARSEPRRCVLANQPCLVGRNSPRLRPKASELLSFKDSLRPVARLECVN